MLFSDFKLPLVYYQHLYLDLDKKKPQILQQMMISHFAVLSCKPPVYVGQFHSELRLCERKPNQILIPPVQKCTHLNKL